MNSVTIDPSFFHLPRESFGQIALAPKPSFRERHRTWHRVRMDETVMSTSVTHAPFLQRLPLQRLPLQRLPLEISAQLVKQLPRLRDIGAFFRSCVYASTVLRDHLLETEGEWLANLLVGYTRPRGLRTYDHLPRSVASRLFGEILDAGTPDAVNTFISHFPMCHNVFVTRAEFLVDNDLHRLFEGLTHLNQLGLVPSQGKHLEITESGWSAPTARIHDLISLHLSGIPTTDVTLPLIAHNGTKLTRLSLEACPVSRLSWHALTERCQALETLLLRSCIIARDVGEIDALGIRLSTLSLSHCEVTDSAIIGTAHYDQLTALDLSANRFLSDGAMSSYIKRCRGLTELNLSQCERIADTTAAAIADICNALRTLSLDDCHKITGNGLKALSQGSAHLEEFCLNNCRHVTDNALATIIAERGSNLQTLSLSGCDTISDATLTQIAANCPHLEALDLSECIKLTDDGLAELAAKCSHLKMLRLCSCPQITDDAIEGMAPRLASLLRLDLGSRPDMTEKTLLALATHCSALATLRVLGCDGITPCAFRPIVQNGARLHGRYAPKPLARAQISAERPLSDCAIM